MKIQEVTIEGYQSHTNSTFRLSPGLTVITGPSDAGKTAIIRALRWFAFNEPTGEAFLHTIRNADGSIKEAVDQAKVSVTFDNGVTITKTRRKGKTSYTHSQYPTAWEKAEVPPEIKETLGLIKQEYGDFETCLNFAFQLDAPFLLSETASVGAKVLGKLSGTEVVDLSISEVNKKTHNTRSAIAYEEKQIGEIDVQLTDYFDLDTHDTQLKCAEVAYQKMVEDIRARLAAVVLSEKYEEAVTERIKLYDEVERLAGVVLAKVQLSTAEREQYRVERLTEQFNAFWKAVADQKEPNRILRDTKNLETLDSLLSKVSEDYATAIVTYPGLLKSYRYYTDGVAATQELIDRKKKEIALMPKLEEAEAKQLLLDQLDRAKYNYGLSCIDVNDAKRTLTYYENIDAIRGKYEALEGYSEKLADYTGIRSRYTEAMATKKTTDNYLRVCEVELEAAKQELHNAWEEAGGVCPLCGTKGVNTDCIH
ncbi:MAG: AAA family ATPase [Lachnospiraceae bacterium]|nr:AAA family ATPase [Lachnospiraceae bacterium]